MKTSVKMSVAVRMDDVNDPSGNEFEEGVASRKKRRWHRITTKPKGK